MKLFRLIFLFAWTVLTLEGKTILLQKVTEEGQAASSERSLSIGVLSSPNVIGRYSQSIFNVSWATLMSRRMDRCEIKRYDIPDESIESLNLALEKMKQEGVDALLAPLTLNGAKNLTSTSASIPIFIPTVHKRDIPAAPDHIVFGGIDYVAQIEALYPYMGNSVAIFYDSSSVGNQLKKSTEEVFLTHKSEKKAIASYPIDSKGDAILSHLSKKPSSFNKASVVLHLPVVKSAMATAQMTFQGIKERNILSTQINKDPTLLTLTQLIDRKNMIVANSLIEFPPTVFETNALMNNDITVDWIQYASSVGIDYLVSILGNTHREYTMRLVHSQIIYPVELLRAGESGFEPLSSR